MAEKTSRRRAAGAMELKPFVTNTCVTSRLLFILRCRVDAMASSWPPKLLQSTQTKARGNHLPWKLGPAKPRADMLTRARCSRQAQWHKVSELPSVYEIRHNRKSDDCFYTCPRRMAWKAASRSSPTHRERTLNAAIDPEPTLGFLGSRRSTMPRGRASSSCYLPPAITVAKPK